MDEVFQNLKKAVSKGKIKEVKQLIKDGANINKEDQDGYTCLHIAVKNGQRDIIEYLIKHGADVEKTTSAGRSTLHLAALQGLLKVMKIILSHGGELNKGDDDGWTALHIAAENGHLDVTKHLISKGADVNREEKDAHNGHIDVTKHLISQGADVNKGNDNAGNGHIDVIKHVISQGAEVNKGDNDGCTALHYAARKGHLNVIKFLIDQGAEVNKTDEYGQTSLLFAFQDSHVEAMEYLISQGAKDVRGIANSCAKVLSAVQDGRPGILPGLQATGARTEADNIHGMTPLEMSLPLRHENIADILDTFSPSEATKSLFYHAVQDVHSPVVEYLVNHGADLNVLSADGQTCLHKAIKLCDRTERNVKYTDTLRKISDEFYGGELAPEKALVFYLLENGAKIDVKDKSGKLPIHYAKDEVVRQMILSRLNSLEDIKSYREKPAGSVASRVKVEENTSQDILLEEHGVSMFIPSDAILQGEAHEITLTLLSDPSSVDIQDEESVACYGVRCDPPNMVFLKPVKIRIPHATLVTNPDEVKPHILSYEWDSVNDLPRISRSSSSDSPEKPPYCKVDKRHLELYIDHSAEWWILIPLEQHVIRHRLSCTPYIPNRIEKGKEIDVHLRLHVNIPGMDVETQEEEKKQSYHKAHPSIPVSFSSKSGDVSVTSYRAGDVVDRKVGGGEELRRTSRRTCRMGDSSKRDENNNDEEGYEEENGR
nr:ankyrin repeat domain-containing protein 50-like [Lytechinus pictus]